MENSVILVSSRGRLTFSDFALSSPASEDWYSFTARIELSGLVAEARVHDRGTSSLPDLFEQMAREYRGWDGEKRWDAMEDQLSLTCTSDRTGHALTLVRLRPNNYDSWEVEAHFQIEAGQHEGIARHLRALLERRAV